MTTTYSWIANTGTLDDWNTAADWSGGAIPPNDGTADIVIDTAPATGTDTYTVDIAAGESIVVDSITLNGTVNAATVGADPYVGAVLEVDGTLTFAAGSAGLIGGPLQNSMVVNGGSIVNAGTVNAFVQAEGSVTFSGTNGIYFTNWLQSQGVTTIDTKTIGEYADLAPNTLSDGIFEAKGSAAVVNLGGAGGGLVVNVATVEGPGTDYSPGLAGYTQLIFDGPGSEINEWNGTAYVAVETSITTIQNNATVIVNNDPVSNAPRDYTTTNALTIGSTGGPTDPAEFAQQGGTLTTGGLTIMNNGTLFGAPTVVGNIENDGTIMESGGTMILQGSVTGTGTMTFDAGTGTLEVNGVAAGEAVVMLGTDTLELAAPAAFLGTISAKAGDSIILQGVTADRAVLTNGTLVVSEGTQTVASIAMSGTYTGDAFTASAVTGGTQLTLGASSAPLVTSVAMSPTDTIVSTGALVTVNLNMSEVVNVAGGNPTLQLNDGETATYASGSGTDTLTFDYTVAAGDNTPDLTVTGSALNGATIEDGSGNEANLAGALMQPTGTLTVDTSIVPTGTLTSGGGSTVPTTTITSNVGSPVMRFLDPKDGIHFYSSDPSEEAAVQANLGYQPEGTAWNTANPNVDASAMPVYRFYDAANNDHFYSISPSEISAIQSGDPAMKLEGIAFYEDPTQLPGDVAVDRFLNTTNGTHFYSANSSEIASLSAAGSSWKLEGVAFYAPTTSTT